MKKLCFRLSCFLWLAEAASLPARGEVVMFDLVPDLTMGAAGINSYDIDINADGIRDVRMISQGSTTGFRDLPDSHVRLQSVDGGDPGTYHAWKLIDGETIGNTPINGAEWINNPITGSGLTTCILFTQLVCFGNFTLEQGYIGVELSLLDGIHYGWIDVQGYLGSGDVRGWAYETQPNVPIIAPEPSRMMLLLIGLLSWIFRRNAELRFQPR